MQLSLRFVLSALAVASVAQVSAAPLGGFDLSAFDLPDPGDVIAGVQDGVSSFLGQFGPGPSGGGGRSKLGLAWANKNGIPINNFQNPKVSWYYSWEATPGWNNAPTDIAFCPMLWGERNVDSFRQNVVENPDGPYNQARCILGMNEVNQRGQSDMSPQTACNLMRTYVIPMKYTHGFYIVSPVTTNAPSGQQWMDEFRATCPDVFASIDAMAIHYYATSVSNFQQYVSNWNTRYGKPIWVTEYACQNFNGGAQCSQTQANIFHTTMAAWFDTQPYVQAYAPFGVMHNLQGVDNVNSLASGDNPSFLFNAISAA
ncbi:hypothetical protein MSPP1_002905 [Malassezia sp. CBS 17886]|nr:hypothetical protein MSPP1_002905 [Malassezia sp. CBS 17886]